MLKKTLTVTVAIPAFNDAGNIRTLISEILSQRRNNFVLDKILVISDGSTDNTVALARSFKEKVTVVDHRTNLGKLVRMNEIFSLTKSDILIQSDADMKLMATKTLERLVQPFYTDPNVGLSCAYHKTLTPVCRVEKWAHFGFRVWDRARIMLGDRGNLYYCEGGLRGFSKLFTTKFRLPENLPIIEDYYSYLWARTHGFQVAIVKNSFVFVKLPETISDYFKQMKRFLTAPKMLEENFGPEIMSKYYTMTTNLKLRAFFHEALKTPTTAFGYGLLQLATKVQMPFYRQGIIWQRSFSAIAGLKK